jgi:hypothetical protein
MSPPGPLTPTREAGVPSWAMADRVIQRGVLLATLVVVLAGCATADGSRPPSPEGPPPSSSQLNGLGYDDAVRLGAAFASSMGYQYELAEAHWTGKDWDVRFHLHDGAELRELQLKIDALTREVTRTEQRMAAGDAGSLGTVGPP